VLLALGVAGSSAYDTIREAELRPGESMAAGAYTLTYQRLDVRDGRNAVERRAVVDVERDGRSLGTLEAGKNAYRAEGQVSNEVGIRSDWRTGEDLFVIADEIAADGTVLFEVHISPLVNLIWIAGGVFLLGSLVALWPDAREQRRLAERYAGVPARA
jgi:cytochrome c-type biogenesis protein CcmF